VKNMVETLVDTVLKHAKKFKPLDSDQSDVGFI
jgi:hypothetical protein